MKKFELEYYFEHINEFEYKNLCEGCKYPWEVLAKVKPFIKEKIAEILDAAAVKKKIKADGISVKLPQDICEKYLDGMDPDAVLARKRHLGAGYGVDYAALAARAAEAQREAKAAAKAIERTVGALLKPLR